MAGSAGSAREARLDALKGFAILCVVTYHALGQYFSWSRATGVVYFPWAVVARAFLFSFMLPLFAFLSGYVLGRAGGFRPRDYFKKRTLGLLVPYVCWETLYGPTKHPEMFDSLKALGLYYVHIFTNPHFEGRMWYLYVLWLALMVLGIVRLGGDRTWLIVLSIPLVYVAASFGMFRWLRWIYLFVAAGVLFRRYEPAIKPRLALIGVLGAIAYWPLWLLVEPAPVSTARLVGQIDGFVGQQAGNVILDIGPVLVGVCAVLALVAVSYHIPGRLEALLAVLGTYSLGVYITHFPFVEMWRGMPWWFLPVNVAIATTVAVGWTIVLGKFRITATLLLGEPWVRKPRELGDVKTETL